MNRQKQSQASANLQLLLFEALKRKLVVQLLSVCSCASAFAAAPLILTLDSGLDSFAAKASIASTLCCFGIFTTGAPS